MGQRYAADVELPRWTLGRMQNPVRGFLHGSAAVLAVLATPFLIVRAPTWPSRLAVLVFGISMVGLYATSSLYHSVPWPGPWKKRMQRLDHSMIYVLIAGTYTPALVVVLDPPLQWIGLGVMWGIVAFGIGQHLLFPRDSTGFSVGLATTMGWLGVLIAWPFIQTVGLVGVALAVVGGVLYTVGMVFLVTNRPRLWPRVFSYHEAFHVLVVLATATHFVVLWRYVVPLAA
jgi:hemolysin III